MFVCIFKMHLEEYAPIVFYIKFGLGVRKPFSYVTYDVSPSPNLCKARWVPIPPGTSEQREVRCKQKGTWSITTQHSHSLHMYAYTHVMLIHYGWGGAT